MHSFLEAWFFFCLFQDDYDSDEEDYLLEGDYEIDVEEEEGDEEEEEGEDYLLDGDYEIDVEEEEDDDGPRI